MVAGEGGAGAVRGPGVITSYSIHYTKLYEAVWNRSRARARASIASFTRPAFYRARPRLFHAARNNFV
ncbi:hypothetical protein [Streptomyces cyaneogriseus]|uniref:hypothetical protein n=1 Tax=Streptomyces cyaneogriseus TaxID=68192 RepID=UPI0013316304|nr:hypothetical protein [Streptomyces cyaneogriseus]